MNQKNMPKYLQIEVDLIDKINNGLYSSGEALPTEEELSKYYGVSRVTVRNALSKLVQKGYINKHQGSGNFVSDDRSKIKSPSLKSFTEEMSELGQSVETEVVSFNIITSEPHISKLLKIQADDKVYYIERLRKSNGLPMMFERTFMSMNDHLDLSIGTLKGSKIQYADKHKLELSYAEQIVEPFIATVYIANLLGLREGEAILRVKNTTYLEDGKVFDYTELFLHPKNYHFSIIKGR